MVLVILAAMVTVTIPYATRSHDGLKLDQESRNVAEAIRYATHLAGSTNQPVRFVLDTQNSCYLLERATAAKEDYVPIEDSNGAIRHLDPKIRIADITGFDPAGKDRYCLSFNSERPWPQAALGLSLGDLFKTVRVAGKLIEIEDAQVR
jgi:type II secretory pathway pseudopilin PulG